MQSDATHKALGTLSFGQRLKTKPLASDEGGPATRDNGHHFLRAWASVSIGNSIGFG